MHIFLRILKWIGLFIFIVIIGLLTLPWLPVLSDQFGKSTYQDWLDQRATPLQLDAPDTAFAFHDEFYDNRFIMLSEVHGYETVQRLDLALLKHLRETTDRPIWYLAEIPPHVAHAFNLYILHDDVMAAREAFEYWADASDRFQWGNRNFFDKLTAIRDLNGQLSTEKKIRFIGVDKPQTDTLPAYEALATQHTGAIDLSSDAAAAQLASRLAYLALQRPADAGRYDHIIPNIEDVLGMKGADEVLFYGLWGQFHAMRTEVNGVKPLAARLHNGEGIFADKVGVVSTVCIEDCLNMMPAGAFPGVPKPPNGEDYIQLPLSYDSTYFLRVRGVGELAKAGGDYGATLIPLIGVDSPYHKGKRIISASGYLALMQRFKVAGPPSAVMDYLVVIKGSQPLTPWRGQAWDMQ